MLSGDDANYSAMAAKYRNYLLDNGLVTKKDDSYNTRVNFLGTDREEFLGRDNGCHNEQQQKTSLTYLES